MAEARLKKTLEQLRAQLDRGESLDDADLELLHEVHDDIERLLEQTQETRREELPRVQEGVGSALERFEAQHPKLTELLDSIARTLASLGL